MKLVLLGIFLSLSVAVSINRSGLDASENNVNDGNDRPNVNLLGSDETLNNFLTFQQWKSFKDQHGKTYSTAEEEHRRFKIFKNNLVIINKHNKDYEAGEISFELAVNHFTDWTNDEFRHKVNGYRQPKGDRLPRWNASTFLVPLNFQEPTEVDWRKHGYVTPVKNQGHCGSCWAFSTTGALEGQHMRKTGKMVSLSEQNLVDCSEPYGNNGCNGGLMDNAFQYIKENGGIDIEKFYPYEGKDARCRYKKEYEGAEDSGYVDVKPPGNETMLLKAVASVGPVSVAIDASHESFQFYNKGVYIEKDCSPENLDHGVLAVGYGTEKGVDYWIVKNSWGEEWGEKGYIRMARNHQNMCGIATAASYPSV